MSEQRFICGPSTGSHHSMVHGSPSSMTVEPAAVHRPDALHSPSVHTSMKHSVPVGTGDCVTVPVAGSHVPEVQGLSSSVDTGIPGRQTAAASQSSLPLHASKSLQLV